MIIHCTKSSLKTIVDIDGNVIIIESRAMITQKIAEEIMANVDLPFIATVNTKNPEQIDVKFVQI